MKKENNLLRKGILDLRPYIPGKSIEEVKKRELGLKEVVKLASNETSIGPPALAIEAIKEADIKLPQRVRILFGTNEESGSRDIKYYLEQGGEIPIVGFTPDGDYPVANSEKGIIFFDAIKVFRKKDSPINIKYIKGGIAANMVPAYCEVKLQIRDNILKDKIIKKFEQFIRNRGYQIEMEQNDEYLILKSKGIAAHAMEPEKGENAIMQLICFLDTIDLGPNDVVDYIHWLVENIGVAYGPRFPGAAVVEHQPNEYIKIEDLILNAKIYAHAIYELSQKDWNL